jgi:hypothetical protein
MRETAVDKGAELGRASKVHAGSLAAVMAANKRKTSRIDLWDSLVDGLSQCALQVWNHHSLRLPVNARPACWHRRVGP